MALVLAAAPAPPALDGAQRASTITASEGYWLVGADGGIFAFGDAGYHGAGRNQSADIAGMGRTTDGQGYWAVDDDGDIFHYGNAINYGSRLVEADDVGGFAARPQGDGYWIATRDGEVSAFGAAPHLGPHTPLHPNRPVVGMAATPSGRGYWLVASDGGIFSFGDARFHGSTGAIVVNQPIVGMASTGTGGGYWLVASDGGVFSFGDAGFHGSTGSLDLNQPIVAMVAAPTHLRNAVPAPVADSATVDEDGGITVDVLANDAGLGDGGISVTITSGPDHGRAEVHAGGRITYTPFPDYAGPDALVYRVTDVDGDSATATLTLTLTPRNDAPVVAGQSRRVDEDSTLTRPLGATDVDGDTLSYAVSTDAAHGAATVDAAGTYTYQPAPNYQGPDAFTITVSDGQGASAAAVITVTVGPVNDPPVAGDQALSTPEDVALAGLVGAVDVDGDILDYAVTGPASSGLAAVGTAGNFTYTPNADFHGADSFTVTVSDGQGGAATAVITVGVEAVNDLPTITGIPTDDVTDEDVPKVISFTVADVETPAGTLTLTGVSSNPAVVADAAIVFGGSGADRSVTVTPLPDANGSTTVTVTVSDGEGGLGTAVFVLDVTPVDDAAAISTIPDLTIAMDTSTGPVAFTITDVDTDTTSLQLTATSSNEALVLATGISFGGSGTDRTVTVTPVGGASGTATITVFVSDGTTSVSTSFLLTVT